MDKLINLRALPVQHRFIDAAVRRLTVEETQGRYADVLASRAADDDRPLYEIAISSEQRVARWYGTEILIHKKSAIDFSYLKRGAAVLVDHGMTGDGDQVGALVPNSARLDDDQVLRGLVVFSRNPRGQEIQRDVEDGIRRFISVGYRWDEAKLAEQSDTDGDTWHVTRWTPMEVSVVSVPADISVGVGRNADQGATPFKILNTRQETTQMDPTTTPAPGTPTPAPVVTAGRDFAAEGAEIVGMCVREGKGELAEAYIRAGKTPNEVGRALLEARAATAPTAADTRPPVALTPKERSRYSILAALRGALFTAEGRADLFGGLEREVHDELERQCPKEYKRHGGVFIPMFTAQRAALDSVTATAAKELVFTQQGEFIDILRNMMVTTRLGATFLPGLIGPVGFPRQTGSAAASWVAENPGADVTETNLTTELMTLSPKTIQATTAYTRQLLFQTSIDVDALVKRDLASVHALKWDQTALHGSGAGDEPAGLYAISGVNAHAAGGIPNFADVIDAETMVALDNAFFGNLGWAMNPALAGKLMQTLVAAAAGSAMIWTGTFENGVVGGYRAIASNQLSATLGAGAEHGGLFGNWADLLIGTWGGFEVITDPYSKKKRGVIEVTTFQMADIDVRHPQSFVKWTGATIV